MDGPGTRFVVSTSGCPLRCLYCQNPDTWRMRYGHRTSVDDPMTEIAKYRRLTGGEIAPTLTFARRLSDMGKKMWVRFVLVPGRTDDPEDIDHIASFVATLDTVERVDVVPFHTLGTSKYTALGLSFPLADTPAPDQELVNRVRATFAQHGIPAT